MTYGHELAYGANYPQEAEDHDVDPGRELPPAKTYRDDGGQNQCGNVYDQLHNGHDALVVDCHVDLRY